MPFTREQAVQVAGYYFHHYACHWCTGTVGEVYRSIPQVRGVQYINSSTECGALTTMESCSVCAVYVQCLAEAYSWIRVTTPCANLRQRRKVRQAERGSQKGQQFYVASADVTALIKLSSNLRQRRKVRQAERGSQKGQQFYVASADVTAPIKLSSVVIS